MATEEITLEALNVESFIDEQVEAIRQAAGDDVVINALSGGVDSAAVTLIGHKALGDKLKTCFIENGLMRDGEPERTPVREAAHHCVPHHRGRMMIAPLVQGGVDA